MSFLYDKDVYWKIVNAVSFNPDRPETQPYRGAPVGGTNQPIDLSKIVRTMSDRLHSQLTGTVGEPNITTSLVVDKADLAPENLASLDKLLSFLDNNEVLIDGVRIVYSGKDLDTVSEDVRKRLAKMSGKISRDQSDRKFTATDYWVDKNALIKYIKYLQDKAAKLKTDKEPVTVGKGRLMEVMVGKLIEQLNEHGDTGLKPKPKSEPGKPKALPDDVLLDSFEEKLFDIKEPYGDNGKQNPLYAGDLNDLMGWLKKGPQATIMMYDVTPPTKAQITYVKANTCDIINILFLRARNYLSKADANEKYKYQYYMNKITEIGPTFVGPDGQACAVTGAFTTPGAKAPGTVAPGVAGAGVQQAMGHLVQLLPLDTADISFTRIERFFGTFEQAVSGEQTPEAQEANNLIISAMNSAREAMRNTNSLLKQPLPSFEMSADPSQVLNQWVKAPEVNNYGKLLSQLYSVITYTISAIRGIMSRYGNVMGPQAKGAFEGQIGAAPTSWSVGGNNLSQLQRLLAEDPRRKPAPKYY